MSNNRIEIMAFQERMPARHNVILECRTTEKINKLKFLSFSISYEEDTDKNIENLSYISHAMKRKKERTDCHSSVEPYRCKVCSRKVKRELREKKIFCK
jgi:hypothetical protein